MFNLEIPINHTSLGQIGYGILLEIFKRGLKPNIFPIGEPDFRSVNPNPNFQFWLKTRLSESYSDFSSLPTIKHWHLRGSERCVGKGKRILWTPHETDRITSTEKEVCKNYDQILVTSHHSVGAFRNGGVMAEFCPNFFDEVHFYEKSVPQPAKYNWGIFGKMEKRKQTRNSIVAWANKFGGNSDHRLTCLIYNGFLDLRQQGAEINSWFGGNCPYNIQFKPFQEKNSDLNEYYNSIDIIVALNGAEGWNLPLHTCLGLGKHAVVLDATGHKEFANEENSILVKPNGKEEIYDGIFFNKGDGFNQGEMYNFTMAQAHEAFEKALDKLEKCGRVNVAGRSAREFSVSRTVDTLLSYVDN